MQTYSNMQGFAGDVHNAEVYPGERIHLWGSIKNHVRPQDYNRTFKVGDEAKHGQYNMIYTGTIKSIGAKTVSIYDGCDGRTKRLTIASFCDMNWNFDAAKIAAYNAEEMMCI